MSRKFNYFASSASLSTIGLSVLLFILFFIIPGCNGGAAIGMETPTRQCTIGFQEFSVVPTGLLASGGEATWSSLTGIP